MTVRAGRPIMTLRPGTSRDRFDCSRRSPSVASGANTEITFLTPRSRRFARASAVGRHEADCGGRARSRRFHRADVAHPRGGHLRDRRSDCSSPGSRSVRFRGCRAGCTCCWRFGLFVDAVSTTPTVVHVGPLPISLGALVRGGALPRARGRARARRGAGRVDDTTRNGCACALLAFARPLRACDSRSTNRSSRSRSRCGVCRSSSTRCAHLRPRVVCGIAARKLRRKAPAIGDRGTRPRVDRDHRVPTPRARPRRRDHRGRYRVRSATARTANEDGVTSIALFCVTAIVPYRALLASRQ